MLQIRRKPGETIFIGEGPDRVRVELKGTRGRRAILSVRTQRARDNGRPSIEPSVETLGKILRDNGCYEESTLIIGNNIKNDGGLSLALRYDLSLRISACRLKRAKQLFLN